MKIQSTPNQAINKTQPAQPVGPAQTTNSNPVQESAAPANSNTEDGSDISSEAQGAAGAQTGADSGSVQQLVSQLKSDVESVRSTQGAESTQTSTAKTQIEKNYQKLSDSDQLGQVDQTTRQGAEQILGLGATTDATATGDAGSSGKSGAAASESGEAAVPESVEPPKETQQTPDGTYNEGVKNSLDSLLGGRSAA